MTALCAPQRPASVADFVATLAAEGYGPPEERTIPGGTWNGLHTHPFEVKALMLEGELRLACDGESVTYHAGEVFSLAAGREHTEQFGAMPARYLVGRKLPG